MRLEDTARAEGIPQRIKKLSRVHICRYTANLIGAAVNMSILDAMLNKDVLREWDANFLHTVSRICYTHRSMETKTTVR